MRAVDTNVLVYAEIRTSAHHERAIEVLTGLAESPYPWAIPWPCVYEFLRVVTHPRVFEPPVPLDRALEDLGRLMDSPSLLVLSETRRHREVLHRVLAGAGIKGNLVHDAHIAALCLEHGVSELLTADRDFARFPELRISNPFG